MVVLLLLLCWCLCFFPPPIHSIVHFADYGSTCVSSDDVFVSCAGLLFVVVVAVVGHFTTTTGVDYTGVCDWPVDGSSGMFERSTMDGFGSMCVRLSPCAIPYRLWLY